MPITNEDNIYKILASLNPKKAAGNDLIPPKVVSRSAGILCKPLTNVKMERCASIVQLNQNYKFNIIPVLQSNITASSSRSIELPLISLFTTWTKVKLGRTQTAIVPEKFLKSQ